MLKNPEAEPTIKISSGPYSAEVSLMGAALTKVKYRDALLVTDLDDQGELLPYAGAIIAPWVNRIADGRYRFCGVEQQLPINEPHRHNSVHGHSAGTLWTRISQTKRRLRLGCLLNPSQGYPHHVRIDARYRVSHHGLCLTVRAQVLDDSPAPFGLGLHPYFLINGTTSTSRLKIPATEVALTNSDTLIPESVVGVNGTDFDFRRGVTMPLDAIDHSLGGLRKNLRSGWRTPISATLGLPNGAEVVMAWSKNLRWVHVFSNGPESSWVAIEPQTSPPNSFNSGLDQVVLLPGKTEIWRIKIHGKDSTSLP